MFVTHAFAEQVYCDIFLYSGHSVWPNTDTLFDSLFSAEANTKRIFEYNPSFY